MYVKEINTPSELQESNSAQELRESHNTNNTKEDNSTLYSYDPFSDQYEIETSSEQTSTKVDQTVNYQYNFQVHQFINSKFNVWCGRSFIAFSCQICLIIIIVCVVKFSTGNINTKSYGIDGNLI